MAALKRSKLYVLLISLVSTFFYDLHACSNYFGTHLFRVHLQQNVYRENPELVRKPPSCLESDWGISFFFYFKGSVQSRSRVVPYDCQSTGNARSHAHTHTRHT